MKIKTIHEAIINYEMEKIVLNSYAEEDRYTCIDDIYNTYYIDDLIILAKAFNIDLNQINWEDSSFHIVAGLEKLINIEVEKYYQSIDDELALIREIIKDSDLTKSMTNEINQYLDLEDFRFNVNKKLDKLKE